MQKILKNIEEALNNKTFLDDLEKARFKAEQEIRKLVNAFNKLENYKYNFSFCSRAKDLKSLMEKIERNDYDVTKWGLENKKEEDILKIVSTKIKDIIGVRVICSFWEEEKAVFEGLKKQIVNNRGGCIEFIDADVKPYNDGADITIYKMQCVYHAKPFDMCVEVQIKCHMHNVWGEVDHEAVYKNTRYAADYEFVKDMVDDVRKALIANDEELQHLLSKPHEEKSIVKELFYHLTYSMVDENNRGAPLYYPYRSAFDLFFRDDVEYTAMKRYLAGRLVGADSFEREKVPLSDEVIKDKMTERMVEEIKNRFSETHIKYVYTIFCLVYELSSDNKGSRSDKERYDLFLSYLANKIRSSSSESGVKESSAVYEDGSDDHGVAGEGEPSINGYMDILKDVYYFKPKKGVA